MGGDRFGNDEYLFRKMHPIPSSLFHMFRQSAHGTGRRAVLAPLVAFAFLGGCSSATVNSPLGGRNDTWSAFMQLEKVDERVQWDHGIPNEESRFAELRANLNLQREWTIAGGFSLGAAVSPGTVFGWGFKQEVLGNASVFGRYRRNLDGPWSVQAFGGVSGGWYPLGGFLVERNVSQELDLDLGIGIEYFESTSAIKFDPPCLSQGACLANYDPEYESGTIPTFFMHYREFRFPLLASWEGVQVSIAPIFVLVKKPYGVSWEPDSGKVPPRYKKIDFDRSFEVKVSCAFGSGSGSRRKGE